MGQQDQANVPVKVTLVSQSKQYIYVFPVNPKVVPGCDHIKI